MMYLTFRYMRYIRYKVRYIFSHLFRRLIYPVDSGNTSEIGEMGLPPQDHYGDVRVKNKIENRRIYAIIIVYFNSKYTFYNSLIICE